MEGRRTIRDERKGLVTVSAMRRSFTRELVLFYSFAAKWEGGTCQFDFGIHDIDLQAYWSDWCPEDRWFAMARLGMTHFSENILPRAKNGDREEVVLTSGKDGQRYFEAVKRMVVEYEGWNPHVRLDFEDYSYDTIDERIKEDVLFALKESGYYEGKAISDSTELPSELFRNFWTCDELLRNLKDLSEAGAILIRFLAKTPPQLDEPFFYSLSLSSLGEKRARRLTPWRVPLFETAEERKRDSERFRAQLSGDELAQAEQILQMESSIPEVVLRAAGAIAGVVLETHLRRVVEDVNQRLTDKQYEFKKNKDGISSYAGWLIGNGLIKDAERNDLERCVYVRNCCSHPPGANLKPPQFDEVRWLIARARHYCQSIKATAP